MAIPLVPYEITLLTVPRKELDKVGGTKIIARIKNSNLNHHEDIRNGLIILMKFCSSRWNWDSSGGHKEYVWLHFRDKSAGVEVSTELHKESISMFRKTVLAVAPVYGWKVTDRTGCRRKR